MLPAEQSGQPKALYVHLVTSGIPLAAGRARKLARAGVDAVQVSVQGLDDDITEIAVGETIGFLPYALL